MRRLLLLRHAKAERSPPGGRDRDRMLAARGLADAPQIGAYLLHHAVLPDGVVVSPAARTRETWELAAAALGKAPPAVFDERLYNAAAGTILDVVKETGPEVGTLLVVGHNPGIQEAADLLTAAGDLEARQRLKEGFPTSGLAMIDFALDGWHRLHAHSGRLERFVTPRSLAAATD
jgi:phosphohistidine phosphatase